MSYDDYDPEPSRIETDLYYSEEQYEGPNKVQELIEDNKSMRDALRHASNDISGKYLQLLEFYGRIKSSARHIKQQHELSQSKIDDQQREIAFLKADKVNLKEELRRARLTREMGGLEINDAKDMNGGQEEEDENLKAEYDDTVNALTEQLKKADEEKQRLSEEIRKNTEVWKKHWDAREQVFTEQYQQTVEKFRQEFNTKMEEVKSEQNAMVVEKERDNQTLKTQVRQLIAELHSNEDAMANTESVISQYKSNLESKESRIYQLSKEVESMKEQSRSMTEDMIRWKQQYEDMKQQKDEKEKSLDELFEEYNKEREQKQQLELQLLNEQSGLQSEKLDKAYAQYLCAEESLKRKNEEVVNLKKRLESAESQTSVYKQQADIFEKDFVMEREARQKSHNECENLKSVVGQYQIEMQRMKSELVRLQQERNFSHGQGRQPYGP